MRQGSLPDLLATKAMTCRTPPTINQVVIRRTTGLALFLLAICPLAGATTHRIHAGQGRSVIQRVISEATSGDTVSFDAGTYTITSPLTLKCGLTYTGPVATPATAEITTSTANIPLTQMKGGCTSGTTTIEYLHFNGAGAFYADTNNYSNINILHNQMTSIPSGEGCGAICESVYFDGHDGSSVSNITIEYNTFGDDNSCAAGIAEGDNDGNCAGIVTDTVAPMALINFVIKYNTFYHLQEGIHFLPTPYNVGSRGAYCNNCDIEYNFFNQIHRIQVEFQVGVDGKRSVEQYNVLTSPINTDVPVECMLFLMRVAKMDQYKVLQRIPTSLLQAT